MEKCAAIGSQLPDWVHNSSGLAGTIMNAIEESERKTFGMVLNTFTELEQLEMENVSVSMDFRPDLIQSNSRKIR